MSAKAVEDVKSLNLKLPISMMRRIDDWRRQQDEITNVSEAIRRLLRLALDRGGAARKGRSREP
jgi:Arc/MetJ-type ribon-helix-helix transcriptional regulator